MKQGFTSTQKIPYRGTKNDLTTGLPVLASCMMEASLNHTDSTPYPVSWYSENNVGFLLTHWQMEIYKYPKWNDELTIYTCPTSFKGALAERTFKAFIGDKVYACANTSWAYVDLIKRRPTRPSLELLEGYGSLCQPFIERDFKAPAIEDYELCGTRTITAVRHDTDVNRHVNNTVYLEWAMDSVPKELYEKGPCRMKTIYRKECLEGMELSVDTHLAIKNPRDAAVIIRRHEEILCEVYLFF